MRPPEHPPEHSPEHLPQFYPATRLEHPPEPGQSSALSRRAFLASTAAVAAGHVLFGPGLAKAAEVKQESGPWKGPVIGFTKPFAHLSFEETADLVAEVGWDGVDCAVRGKVTHIQPERVEEDLPKMVEALRKRGKEVTMITTDITRLSAQAEKVLRTMAALGVRKYRLGFEHYSKTEHPSKKLAELAPALKDLAAFNKELGVQGGYQNHSGESYFGAPLWDIWTLVKDLDPAALGVCFDIGHATLEGGLSWPIQARLMQPHFTAVFCKDFYWEKTPKGWAPIWCNLGEGMVRKSFFDSLKTTDFRGPICQHHEYKTLGKGPEMLANLQKDLAALRQFLA
jgi:sugar phosphate isomerase/epimerase